MSRAVLDEQIAYYRARASEYDEWFLRLGRYDRGEAINQQWFTEIEELRARLSHFQPRGEVLELAAGTGWWTRELLPFAKHLTAVDSSPEALELNRVRIDGNPKVEFVCADVFEWKPSQLYDVIFFSFWLSHVPVQLFDAFWSRVASALRHDGRVFFIDSLRTEGSAAKNHSLPDPSDSMSLRKLNDGREYRVVKIFYEPSALVEKLERLGWDARVDRTDEFFIHGHAFPTKL